MNTIEVLRSRPGYLGVVEAAEFIDIHRDTLCDWINAGKFKAYRVGNANKIDRLYLADWLEKRALPLVGALHSMRFSVENRTRDPLHRGQGGKQGAGLGINPKMSERRRRGTSLRPFPNTPRVTSKTGTPGSK